MVANLLNSLPGPPGIGPHVSSAALYDAQSSATQDWLMLAHDLRNPLIAMQRVIEIAIGDSGSDRTQDLLAQAHVNCNLLLDMLADVLDSHRAPGYSERAAESQGSPGAVVDQCIQLLQTMADEKNISFHTRVASGARKVVANSRSIIRVLTNLTHNALKFSNPGGTVEITVEDASDDCLMFSVKDQGKGIPQQEAEKIFGMRYQCASSRESQDPGYGWGLYYCKTTLEALGGDIRVVPRSEMAGEGTVISFTVPASQAAQPGGAEPCQSPVRLSA